MKKTSIAALAILAAAIFLASCGTKPITADESAKVLSKVAFQGNQASTTGSLSISKALTDRAIAQASSRALTFDTAITIQNPQGGSVTQTLALSSAGFTINSVYTDWYIEDEGKEYTVGGNLLIACPLTPVISGSSMTTSFTLTGELTISRGNESYTGTIDLTCQYTYTISDTSMTVSCVTRGTIDGVQVEQTASFTYTN